MNQIVLYIIFFVFTIVSHKANANESNISQYKINLSNNRGIPFTIEDGDYAIWGFDVDTDENFWFLSGNPATLVKITKKGDILYKHMYREFKANPIGIKDQKLYVFNRDFDSDPLNQLFIISCDTGKIIQKIPLSFKQRVNSLHLIEKGILVEVLIAKPADTLNSGFINFLYSYEGKFLGEVKNRNGLDNSYDNLKYTYYLGKYDNTPLFSKIDSETFQWLIYTIDIQGQVVHETVIDQNMLGEPFYQAPEDLWCLINDKLFIVYRKDKAAVITELDLKKMMP